MCPTTTASPPTTNILKTMPNYPIPIYSTDEDDDDYDLSELADDYDPTPQFLYDNTNGEPPISWQERRDAEFRKKYGWA